MKDRNWICYLLDFAAIIALIGTAISLAAAFWFQASVAEAIWFKAFGYGLATSVGLLLAARITEITGIMRSVDASVAKPAQKSRDNVEALPSRERLPQAA